MPGRRHTFSLDTLQHPRTRRWKWIGFSTGGRRGGGAYIENPNPLYHMIDYLVFDVTLWT